jgi:hypothetical protein
VKFKPGTGIRDLTPQSVLAMTVVERVCLNRLGLGYEPTITSADDRVHGPRSKHPSGNAIDVRTKDILREDLWIIIAKIKARLEPLGFDVVFEAEGQPQEHIHIEYDPKAWEA